MADELVLVKHSSGAMVPAATIDSEVLSNWKTGQAYRVKAVRLSNRALNFHRLYFSGLLGITLEYWNPGNGLISAQEKRTLNGVIKFIESNGSPSDSLRHVFNAYLANLKERRAHSIDVPSKSKEALHEWVKDEAGLVEVIMTPRGPKRKTKSINFNSMSQEEFNQFYKDAFRVCWNFILSRTFEDEAQAENAINQLLALG